MTKVTTKTDKYQEPYESGQHSDEMQIGHLVRMKGEPYIDSAVIWTTMQKLQKLKQMTDFSLGESGNQLGAALRNHNFVNDEMVSRAEKNGVPADVLRQQRS